MKRGTTRCAVGRFAIVAAVNLALFGVIVAAAEHAASLAIDRPGDHFVSHWRFNHTWKPNGEKLHTELVRHHPDFPDPYLHVYNAQGWLEDYDIERQKPRNTFRIFYVGDSFTEGTVPMEQSVPSRVERALKERARGGPLEVEVINTGTSSYSTVIYYLLIRYAILDYAPDLIVVNVDMSDNYDDWTYWESVVLDENGDPFAAPPRDIYRNPFIQVEGGELLEANPWNRFQLFLYANSHVYNLILQWLPSRMDPAAKPGFSSPERWPWCKPVLDEEARRQLALTTGLLKKIAELARANGVALLLTGVPHYPQYHRSESGVGRPFWSTRPHERMERIAKRTGVAYLNSYEALAPLIEGSPRLRYYNHPDFHFNARGYEIWADAQLAFLLDPRNDLLPRDLLARPTSGSGEAGR